MTKSNDQSLEPVSPFYAGGNRSAADLSRSVPAARPTKPATSRSRISAEKAKRHRPLATEPTPERMAKGDTIRTKAGFHRSIPMIERLRDEGKLDHHPSTNEAMFQAAEKLRRHFDGCLIGVRAQDLNKIIGRTGSDDPNHEEAWVHNFDCFRKACRLMGWFEESPHRGAARIVVAVICFEMTVQEAARMYLGVGRTEVIMAAGMDRLREGLFALSAHWRII